MNSIDILAKLLASENISVIRANSKTASFDVKNRVLVLPKWKEMSTEVEEMLILHEVGHALFTSMSGYIDKLKENRTIAGYANVIEDVRIERKMKERYPGSRKSFFIGYRELNNKDFFGVKSMNLDDSILIDRINLYYKVGYNCGVRFTETERKFLIRIEKAETEQEVIALAHEIYEFSKSELKEKMESLTSINPDIFGEEDEEDDLDYDDFEYGDEEGEEGDDEDGESEDEKSVTPSERNSGKEGGSFAAGAASTLNESDLESKTYAAMQTKLEDLSDDDVEIHYFVPEFNYTYFNNETLVSYKKILSVISAYFKDNGNNPPSRPERQASSNNMVSYLIKEFEMKKAASAYKYAKVSKTGQLDIDKIYAYKLKEDLFKQITRTQDGKKHGMIFLLDWSGSMQDYLEETIDQVVNLSLFCHRAQIPFQVLAFTDRFYLGTNDYYNSTMTRLNPDGLGSKDAVCLMELFSNKMTNLELNQMIAYLSTKYVGYRGALPECMDLGGTPLNHALIYLSDYIGKFMKVNGVEKMSFITLSDGEGGGLEYSGPRSNMSGRSWSTIKNKLITHKSYLRDPITKKEYMLSSDSSTQTSALMNLIRDRYNCKVLGFYVVSNKRKEILRYCTNNMPSQSNYNTAMDIQVKLKSAGYCIQHNVPGRDEFYLLDSKKMNVAEGNMDDLDSSSNSRQIARTFSKMMNVKKTSRVVLNSFINQIA